MEITAASGVPVGDALNAARGIFLADTFYETTRRWTSLTFALLGDPAMPYRGDEAPVPTSTMSFGAFKSRYSQ